MVKLYESGVYLIGGSKLVPETEWTHGYDRILPEPKEAKKGTITYGILETHNTSESMEHLKLRFDSMTSHDITYVGVIQTARASGMERFPLPYVLTNCHNSLCAVGGTINEDDHVFGMSACKKYGGIFVPPHMAVMHQYMREMMAGCGRMILGSDSHTRYGALGTLGIGEGGGELVKQLLGGTYDMEYPQVVAVYLDGKPAPGIGPQDIALAIIGAVFASGYVKNKILEFVGPGVASISTDYRNGIDVMTTETTCLSSVWQTDGDTKAFLETHKRGAEFRELRPGETAYYDGAVYVDLSAVKSMIALPFHPSNIYEIAEVNQNAGDILREIEKTAMELTDGVASGFHLTDKLTDGKLTVTQGIIAGCAGGTYTNVMQAAHMLKGSCCGGDYFSLSIYPSSQPVYLELVKKGAVSDLMAAGAVLRTAFCGPCFGAGDTPANNGFSIRHTTRNFPNREGSKPGAGQMAAVALMDARSIAATALHKGRLTEATEIADDYRVPEYSYDGSVYHARVYQGFGKAEPSAELIYGPNIKDWPEMGSLADHVLLQVCSKILDPVTTTDELIPSGETSSYRSNPVGLAEFTLFRRDPSYVKRAKRVDQMERGRRAGVDPSREAPQVKKVFEQIRSIPGYETVSPLETEFGSVIYARRPGDGSAREQAASCQRVLGGLANICEEYATRRYRSNLINWGMLPFQMKEGEEKFEVGSYLFVPDIRNVMEKGKTEVNAYVLGDKIREIQLHLEPMSDTERAIIRAGCLINFNRNR